MKASGGPTSPYVPLKNIWAPASRLGIVVPVLQKQGSVVLSSVVPGVPFQFSTIFLPGVHDSVGFS